MIALQDYDGKTIQVIVLNSQGTKKRITCKVDQHVIKMKDGVNVKFTKADVFDFWVQGTFRGRFKKAVEWRSGTLEAIHQDFTKDTAYLPPISQADTTNFVKHQILNALDSGKKVIENWQFWVLLIGIIAVAIIGILSLFGVHLSGGGTTTIIQNITSTPHPTVLATIPPR